MKKGIIFTLLCLLAFAPALRAQDASEIVRKAEEKLRGQQTSQASITMTIVRPTWSREISLKSWSKGDDYSMVLVTAPARDKGTANLKVDKEVWSWMPSIDRTIKLPPSMMSQSWMGSDFTNDDLVREFTLSEDYTHKLLGTESIEGRSCYQIELIPKEAAAVVWGKILLWISQEEYLQLKAEFYDEDGYLINLMTGSEVREIGGRTLATRMEMIPVEEEGHKTVLEYNDIVFNEPIPDRFFTVQNMKRLR